METTQIQIEEFKQIIKQLADQYRQLAEVISNELGREVSVREAKQILIRAGLLETDAEKYKRLFQK